MISRSLKRSYAAAGFAAVAGGFAIELDGKPVRTPAKAPLTVPNRALAAAVAAEWQAQGERVDPLTMPLMRLASIALDLVAPRRSAAVAALVNYAGTDLVCYRAASPPELVRRQHAAWQPLVEWVAERYGAGLAVTAAILPLAQPAAALAALGRAVESYDDWALAALNLAAAACGSVVVALALAEGRLDAEHAFAAAQLEESFEIERWGEDAEQMQRRALLRADIAAARHFLALLGA
jgi:chaperone required for assembly of F1-ATPase